MSRSRHVACRVSTGLVFGSVPGESERLPLPGPSCSASSWERHPCRDPVASSMLSAGALHVLRVQASVDAFVRLDYALHFVTLGEEDARAENGQFVLVGVPDSLRAQLQWRSH